MEDSTDDTHEVLDEQVSVTLTTQTRDHNDAEICSSLAVFIDHTC